MRRSHAFRSSVQEARERRGIFEPWQLLIAGVERDNERVIAKRTREKSQGAAIARVEASVFVDEGAERGENDAESTYFDGVGALKLIVEGRGRVGGGVDARRRRAMGHELPFDGGIDGVTETRAHRGGNAWNFNEEKSAALGLGEKRSAFVFRKPSDGTRRTRFFAGHSRGVGSRGHGEHMPGAWPLGQKNTAPGCPRTVKETFKREA